MTIHEPLFEDHRIEFDLPDFYPKQYQAIFDPRRYSIIEASTKSGKTSACISWLIWRALKGGAGEHYWWVAPVQKQADDAFRRACKAIRPELRMPISSNPKSIRIMPVNTTLWFHTGENPDNLYGADVQAAVIDEASRCKEAAWHAVRSTLTATRGPIRIIGNVKGRKNWFFKLARRAQAGAPNMGYHKLISADAVAAGVLSSEEIADAKEQLPEAVFRELYLAEPSDDQGNPFGLDAIRKCIGPLSKGKPLVWGWDLAKSQDWTVGIALDSEGHVCRFLRFRDSWEGITRKILAETGDCAALVDSSGVGDPIVERLQKESIHFEGYGFTGPSKQKLMEGLAVAIQKQEIRFPEGVIREELENFEYVYNEKTRNVRYSAPEGFHDDCVMALALAVMHQMRAMTYDSSYDWVGGPGIDSGSDYLGIAPPPRIDLNKPAFELAMTRRRRWDPQRGWH